MKKKTSKRYIPLLVLLFLIILIYFFEINKYYTLEWLKSRHEVFTLFVQSHPFLAPGLFFVIYIISICLVIPDSLFLSVSAGVFFPFPLAIFLVCISETIGAFLFFLIMKYSIKPGIYGKQDQLLKKFEREFLSHQASYLLFLRLSHLFPFWLINALSAFFKARIKTFLWTTFVGVIPLSFFLVQAGSQLQKILAVHEKITIKDIFTPRMQLTMFGIGLLALLPILLKKKLKLPKLNFYKKK